MQRFSDRTQAGQLLADALAHYADQPNVLVLALPRGGVAVAKPIAQQLQAPLDLCLVRKLGVPGHEELALGAIAYDGDEFVQVVNPQIIQSCQISQETIQHIMQDEQAELLRRNSVYRQGRPLPNIRDKTIIIVDDGIATGATMRAAVSAIKHAAPKRLIIAVPVAEQSVCEEFAALVDEVVCILQPDMLYGVGFWYEQFPQLTDAEVIELLDNS